MALKAQNSWRNTFSSFSGCDINAIVNGYTVAEMQGVTFSTTREKAPVYRMGKVDPVSYSRGKRGIAGAMVFLTFDRGALLDTLGDHSRFFSRQVEVDRRDDMSIKGGQVNRLGTSQREIKGGPGGIPTDVVRAQAWYPDQIPPFNIVLIAENEYGAGSIMSIIGAEILNNGSGVSVDDITTDEQMTYAALGLQTWRPLVTLDPQTGNATDDAEDLVNRMKTFR